MSIHKNEVYYADLSPVVGSEQGGTRPVLIIQNDIGNHKSPTVIVAAITSRKKKMEMPTHIRIHLENGKLPKNSIAMLEQIRTIDKDRLFNYVGKVDTTNFTPRNAKNAEANTKMTRKSLMKKTKTKTKTTMSKMRNLLSKEILKDNS